MKLVNMISSKQCPRMLAAVVVLLLAFAGADTAQAQYEFRWLSVGDFQHRYSGGLGQPEIYDPFPMMRWPAIQSVAPGGVSYMHVMAYWISAKNWVGPDGEEFSVRTSHSGPRVPGVGEFFQTGMRLISQFPAPEMTVDGLETFQVPVTVDEVDPTLKPDRMVYNEVNTSIGVTVEQRAIQYSNELHDDYHITEFRFTNTGNIDGDSEVELPDQVLEDVYFSFIRRPKTAASSTSWGNAANSSAWGAMSQTDIVGNGEHDYGLPDSWRGEFTWLEANPERAYSTIGGPMWVPGSWWYTLQEDTTGRLGAAAMHGEFILHADGQAHAPDPEGLGNFSQSDDPSQPRVMTYMNSDDPDITTGESNHNNVGLMQIERDWIENGIAARSAVSTTDEAWYDAPPRAKPAQPYIAYPVPEGQEVVFGDHFATTEPSNLTGSWSYGNNFGPYDMQPGEEVRVVVFDGVGGLSFELAEKLGRWYRGKIIRDGMSKEAAGELKFFWNPVTSEACSDESETDCVGLTKDEWVMTTRDSLFQLIERAFAVVENDYEVLSPPKPPTSFNVRSLSGEILIEWEADSDPAGGWELYRARDRFLGVPAPHEVQKYKCIAGCEGADPLPGSARSYSDTEPQRGFEYYYYLQAVGGPTSVDPLAITGTPNGMPLKSSRYYAQSYSPATLKRPPFDQPQSPEAQRELNAMNPDRYACSAEPGTVCNYLCPESGEGPDGGSCTPGMIVSRKVIDGVEGVRIVPNPFNLGSEYSLYQPEDQLRFMGLPGEATIRIFTELGELVKTIEHTDGSGDAMWTLTTDSNQRIVSGIYIAMIQDKNTGEQVIRKFVIIR